MLELELTRYFVKVIQQGSFSKAAAVLNMPKSTLSKAITRLERETGTKLLLRTTRSLTLTAAGRAFYDSCIGAVQILEDAQKSLYGQDSILSGFIKLTAPEDLGTRVVAPVIASLAKKHSALNFELHYSDDVLDLVKEGLDIAVRIGRVAESSFKVRRAGDITMITVASPAYLRSREKIRHPRDLSEHDCLSYSDHAYSTRWTLRGKQQSIMVPVRSRVASNQMTSVLKTAVLGAGVAMVPQWMCKADLASGKLVRVLPEWSLPGLPVSIITPLAPSSSARLKIVVDALLESLSVTLAD